MLGVLGVLILAPVPACCSRRGGAAAAALDEKECGLLEEGTAAAAAAINDGGEAAAKKPDDTSLLETLRFVASSRAMQLLVPLIFYNGASIGFFQTMYPLAYQDQPASGSDDGQHLLPKKVVGYVAATFYLTNSLCSYAWGRLVPSLGRRPLFLLAALTHAAFFALVLLLALDAPALALAHESVAAYALVFGLSITFAVGDSVLESQIPALAQSPAFLPSERDRAAAISNVRLWQSLGFASQFVIGIVVPGNVWLQAAVLVPMGLLAAAALATLDTCVRPLSEPAAGYAAVGAEDGDGSGAAAAAAGGKDI